MAHIIGPVDGVKRSDAPLGIDNPPPLFGADLEEYFVSPLTTFQDQEDKNTCVWHAFFYSVESLLRAAGVNFQGCIADGYSGTLWLDGNEGKDVGVQIASACRWMRDFGVLSSFERPYKSDDVTRRTTDPAKIARRMKGLNPAMLPVDEANIRNALQVTGGVPFGQEIRKSHVPDANGVVPVPDPNTDLVGLHMTTLVGWSNDKGYLVAESWRNFGIDHPRATLGDAKFAHLVGKRGFTWRPAEWLRLVHGHAYVFEPLWIKGRLDIK